MDSIAKPTQDEFTIANTLPCLRCKTFPVGEVQQCTSCEGLFCEWCAKENKKEFDERAKKPKEIVDGKEVEALPACPGTECTA